jgi:hypothetical protein
MINIKELLGSDSISKSRIIINDNFKLLADELNVIGDYFNASTGELKGLNILTTETFQVGLNVPKFLINSSGISLNDTSIKLNGNTEITGIIINDSQFTQVINDVNYPTGTDLGSPTTTPDKSVYKVSNTQISTPLIIQLYDGKPGQEITFVYESNVQGEVQIKPASGTTLILDALTTYISMSQIGATITLKCVKNGIQVEWYIVSGFNFSIL